MNGRLVKYFEDQDVLPETQCGFRAGRGTADMIFALRMATELARAKKLPLCVLFVDLMRPMTPCRVRAYGRYSGLRESPNSCCGRGRVSQLRPSYGAWEGMSFSTPAFACILGRGHGDLGTTWHCRIDGSLCRHMDTGTLNKYATWESLMLHDLGYADDAAFITDTFQKLVSLVTDLQQFYHLKSSSATRFGTCDRRYLKNRVVFRMLLTERIKRAALSGV